MANKIKIKRTTVSGRTPNTTNSSNTQYIEAGEVALNLTDEKMFSSNGSVSFEIGANLVNLSVTNTAQIDTKLQVGDHGGSGGYDFGSLALIEGDGNQNGYLQVVIQNASNGEFSSSDFVAVADDGNDTSKYADFGINGSQYNGPDFTLSDPYDAYLYSSDGNLTLGSLAAKDIIFHSAGGNTENELARFTTAGELRIGNSSVNTSITDTLIVASNLEIRDTATINTNSITIGNSTVNTVISANVLDIGGEVQANGGVGTAGQVLKSAGSGANAYWGTVSGGTGTPGGTNTQVQFNDSDTFGGDAGLTYNKTTDALTVAGSMLVGANVIANTSALFVGNSSLNTIISSTSLTVGREIVANSSVGTAGYVLKSAGSGSNVYWSALTGDIEAVTAGVGLSGGGTTGSVTISVTPNTGIIANATGVYVNSAYIATISANNASFLGGSSAASYALLASPTFTGTVTTANLTIGGVVSANGSLGSNGYVLTTTGTSGNTYWFSVLEPVGAITKDMTGHLNRTDSTLSVNNATRTVTWTPDTSSVVYFRGKPYTISTAISNTFADTDGGHYMNYDIANNTLYDAGATGGIRDNILVAYVYWDATNNEAIIFGDERHGASRDVEWHYANHRNVGAVWRSGGGLSYTLDSDTAVSVGVGTPIVLADEDLEHNITHSATPNGYYQQILNTAASLPVIWRNGTSYSQTTANTVPWLFGTSRAQYNLLTGNSGSLADAGEGEYISYWLIATNDMQQPIKLVIGNFSHATVDAAFGESIADIGLYFAEMAVMYQIVVQTSTTFTGNAKRVKIAQVRQVVANALSRQTITAASHGELTGRDQADQHPTSAITGLDTILNGLGTMSTQNANNVTITGGTINVASISFGTNVSGNTTVLKAGNSTMASALLTLGGQVNANGSVGTAGQVLTSGAAGNVYWSTVSGGSLGGSNTQIIFNDSGSSNGSAAFTFNKSTNTVIVSNTLQVTNKLQVGPATGYDFSAVAELVVDGNTNTYLQSVTQNANTGNNASSEFVATADTGNDSVNFVSFGINGSAYNQAAFSIGGALDAYLYSSNSDLTIGTAANNGAIVFHANGTTSTNEVARITTTGLRVGNATANIMITGTDVTKNTVSIIPFGQQTIWVPAVAMYPQLTNGAAAGTVEVATSDQIIKTLNFDATTQEFAQFAIQMPKSWDLGDIVAQFVWSHDVTTTNFGVVWQIQGYSYSDNTVIDQAWGTAVTAADTGGPGGVGDIVFITPETSAVTIGGTPGPEEYVIFRVARAPANASDTMSIDARLHGVKIHYTTNAASDT